MSSNILIVDDEKEISTSIAEFLKAYNYNSTICMNGLEALNHLKQNSVDLILSDIKMPQMSGLEFYNQYKLLPNANARFVLMTGYTDLHNAELAYEKGIDEILAKPFNFDTLKLILDYLLETSDAIGSPQDNYYRMSIEEFAVSTNSEYNLYIKANHRYVCITKTDQEFTNLRLKSLAQKGLQYIYLNSADYAKYTDFQFINSLSKTHKPISLAQMKQAHRELNKIINQHPLLTQIDPVVLKKAKRIFENYSQIIFDLPKISDLFSSVIVTHPQLAINNALLGILSICIIDLWKWTSPKIHSRLVLSSLICDIGLYETPHLTNKKYFELTPDERVLFDNHPLRGQQLLKNIGDIPEEVFQMISQHHENSDGTGYPLKLQRSKLHPFSKIIHALTEFLEVAADKENNPLITLNQLAKTHRKLMSEQMIKSLYLLYDLEVPKELQNLLLPDQSGRLI